MSTSDTKTNGNYENQISEIIQGELIEVYGANGYRSIMQTMKNICGKSEKEIITNYELFAELAEGVFGRLADGKILDPIKKQIEKIGEENIQQVEKTEVKKPMKLLIADDEPEILELYKVFLESKGKETTLTTDGKKCIDAYKKDFAENNSSSFDLVILDQKMPFMTGLQAATEILKINPQQRILFASGYLEKTLLEILSRLDRAIAVIEKPFSLDVLNHMVDNTTMFEKLDKVNINQTEKEIDEKMAEAMTIIQNQF
ncbi:response regulator [Nitrosopumilus sp.]|uniref:response regulator n=1 Tax=Nitrosopumilus sp. TaxID=2024843 RepID=UPI00261704E6|nr:response regulator [Nitrosopumilus sp.]